MLFIQQGLRVGQERHRTQTRGKARTPAETPEKPVKAQDFTFWAFPGWRKTRTPGAPSAERSKEKV